MPTKEEMYRFHEEIEKIISGTDYNYMEAIIEYCNRTGMEVEVASTLVNKDLKAKIEIDAQALNLLPKTQRLPI